MRRPRLRPAALAATVVALASAACLFDPVDLGAHDDFRAEFDLFWQTMDREYVGFAFADTDWDSAYTAASAMVDTVSSQYSLCVILSGMMQPFADAGMHVTLSGSYSWSYAPEIEVNCDSTVLFDNYLVPQGFVWFAGGDWGWCMFGDVIYLLVYQWDSGLVMPNLDAVLEEHPEAAALLIDIRLNGGSGSSTRIGELCRRFNDQTRTGYYYVGRGGPGRTDFGDPVPRQINTRAGYFDEPVVLLTGEQCSRISEEFAAMCRTIPGVTIIGDTTMGQVGHTITYALPGNTSFSFPDTTILAGDSVLWLQEAGLPPDLYVEATEEQFAAGVDPVLEYALGWSLRGAPGI